jgi:hypothetical protein
MDKRNSAWRNYFKFSKKCGKVSSIALSPLAVQHRCPPSSRGCASPLGSIPTDTGAGCSACGSKGVSCPVLSFASLAQCSLSQNTEHGTLRPRKVWAQLGHWVPAQVPLGCWGGNCWVVLDSLALWGQIPISGVNPGPPHAPFVVQQGVHFCYCNQALGLTPVDR